MLTTTTKSTPTTTTTTTTATRMTTTTQGRKKKIGTAVPFISNFEILNGKSRPVNLFCAQKLVNR